MSGILAQLGAADETVSPPVTTAGAGSGSGVPFIATLTFGSAHGLKIGDTFTLAGYTPSTYNGTWVVATVPTSTTLTFFTTTLLATATVQGTITAASYATITTPSRFFEFNKSGLKLDMNRMESAGLRAATLVQRSDRWAIDRTGASGAIELEVQSKGFGFWLKYLLGIVATTGPTDSAFTHTGTIGTVTGKSATIQVGKPSTPAQFVHPFTYPGAKITSWSLKCSVKGIAILTITIDAQDEVTTVALAAASYPASTELLTFAGGAVTIGGTSWDVVTDITISCDMGLNADRRYQRSSTLQKEPIQEKFRNITFELAGDFDGLQTAYNRMASTSTAGAIASIVASWTGKSLIGVSTFPSLTATMANARFDGDSPTVDGPSLLTQKISGRALFDGSTSALSLAYVTLDSTP